MSMASAFEATDMGKAPSKLFLKIAELYRNDFASYAELIEEAMQMLEGTSEVKDSFIQFLRKQAPDTADKIFVAIKSIEEFAIATKALPCSFFDVLSEETISILNKKVLKNKFFMVRHKNLQDYSVLALSLLVDYILNTDNTVATKGSEETENDHTTEEKQVNNKNKQTDNLSFADWITQCAGLSPATARSYSSALNTCDAYAFESHLYSENITLCTKYNEFIIKYNALMNDEGFLKLSEMKHNYLVAVLKKYHDYVYTLNTGNTCVVSSASPSKAVQLNDQPSVSDEVQNNCNSILSQDFEDGYQVGDYMHQMRFLSKNLRELFNNACPSAALDSEYLKDFAIRDIIKIILQDEFDFSSSVITEKGNSLDIGQLYRNYASEHEQLTFREIKEFQDTIGLPIYWGDIFKEMVRISATELIRKDKVQFYVDAVDDALGKMYPNEYTALKDITLFLSLPAASVRWNGYVLESYLRDYSKKFRLVQVSVSNDDYYGFILKSTSGLESYNDVAADMLAKNKSWTDEKSALRCLVDAKFKQRAKNSNISAIVKVARQKRANL